MDGSVGDLGNLLGAETLPWTTDAVLDEVSDELRADEIDEGISNITVVGEVNAKVSEVVVSLGRVIQHLLQGNRIHHVREITEHDSGAHVLSQLDLAGDDILWLVGRVVATAVMERCGTIRLLHVAVWLTGMLRFEADRLSVLRSVAVRAEVLDCLRADRLITVPGCAPGGRLLDAAGHWKDS